MIIGIVAADKNWAIGKKNGLLYELKEDMRHFRQKTSGHIVMCGYNTLLSFPGSKPLTNRVHIVLAPEGIERDDCIVVHSLEECIKIAKELTITEETEIYVIGGGMMYNSMLPYYDKVIVTKVDAEDSEATVFFPNLDENKNFRIVSESEPVNDNGYNIKFVTYERIK